MLTMEKIRPRLIGDRYLDTKMQDHLRNPVFYAALPGMRMWELIRGTEVYEPSDIRKDVPALIVSNHPGTDSTILLPYAVTSVFKRVPTVIVKQSLVDPDYEESTRVLEQTGKKEREKTIFTSTAKKLKTSFIRNAIGTVPIDRNKLRRETIKQANSVLERGEILGVFLQWTRTPKIHSRMRCLLPHLLCVIILTSLSILWHR